MNINKEQIIKALKFYEINDKNYLNKCLECLDYINKYEDFRKKTEQVYNTLYNEKDYLIAKLWKINSKEELFGKHYHPFITSIILLMGYNFHNKNMKSLNLDNKQINIHKKRVKETLLNDIYEKGLDSIRISQMLWGTYFINLKIIEVGRLQYELVNINPVTKKEEKCIKIHIPKDDKLDIDLVKESLNNSKLEIKKYFKLDEFYYYCESWLLSKEVRSCVKDNSNIARFSNMFDITEGEECIRDILNFVYNDIECKDYTILDESTSLKKNLKNKLLNNVIINIGIGKLREDIK